MSVMRTKSIEQSIRDTDEPGHQLKRTLGPIDLTVFGKAVSGGYPMAGGVGGSAEVMSVFGSGLDGKSGAHIQPPSKP